MTTRHQRGYIFEAHGENMKAQWVEGKYGCFAMNQRHQRGYIFEAHGAFHVRYNVREVVEGQQVIRQRSHRLCTKDRATGHGTRTAPAVRQLCEDFMREVNTDVPTPKSMTVVEFWSTVYEPFITANLKPSTLASYQQVWLQHLKAHFGKTLLKDYKTPLMTNYLTLLAKTHRKGTLGNIKRLASSIFAHAVATGNAESNPIRDARILGKTLQDVPTEAYTLQEIEAVISALVEHVDCQLMMALAFFMGLRKGEIQGLQWGDVTEDLVHVRRAFVQGTEGTPKSKKSVRVLPLIAPVKLFFVLWRAKSTGTGWVFPGEKGNPISLKGKAQNIIRPALEKAGCRWKGFHAGRRGLGTTLRALTGNSNAGRDMLGHTDERVTQDHYEAEMPSEVLKGMRLLEAQVTKASQS